LKIQKEKNGDRTEDDEAAEAVTLKKGLSQHLLLFSGVSATPTTEPTAVLPSPQLY